MTGGVVARPMRAPGAARALGAAVKSNSAFAPRRPARRSLRFAVRAAVKGPTFIPDQDKDPEPVPVKTTAASAVQEAVAEPPAPTNYQNNLKQRILARGPRETFFEEDYSITIREYVPTQVKVTVECNGPRFRVRVETDSEAEDRPTGAVRAGFVFGRADRTYVPSSHHGRWHGARRGKR